MHDFEVSKFYTYFGPNHYLDRQALVFNLYLDPDTKGADHYRREVVAVFPRIDRDYPDRDYPVRPPPRAAATRIVALGSSSTAGRLAT